MMVNLWKILDTPDLETLFLLDIMIFRINVKNALTHVYWIYSPLHVTGA